MSKVAIQNKIEAFRSELIAGIDGIVRAAEIYVEAIDEDPRNADVFRESCADWLPSTAWAQFEAVGRKWMHPRLIMGGVADRKKATVIKRLPYSTQERIFEREMFELLLPSGDKIMIDLLEATQEQAAQLCNGSAIRSISEQRAWLEAQKAETIRGESLPYMVKNGTICFRRNVTLTRAELKRLLQEI